LKEESGTVGELADRLLDELLMKYRSHYFNIRNQFRHYKILKEAMEHTECMIHIDFAENYVSKMSREIQTMHFGASLNQITLHTGFFKTGTMEIIQSFCGVSDSLQHDPSSIWAFLNPILKHIRDAFPTVTTIHFFSDGPTSQYKQKGNFFLLSTEIFQHGLKKATWNFHAAGHGKGIPDGIGATLKRSADRQVHHGKTIRNAEEFMKIVEKSDSSIRLYIVRESDILETETKLREKSLKTIPGTMKIHQVITDDFERIKFRCVSCMCNADTCIGHTFDSFDFSQHKNSGNGDKDQNMNQENHFQTPSQVENRHRTDTEAIVIEEGNRPDFEEYLQEMQVCVTFDELKSKCQTISEQIGKVSGQGRSFEGFCVDHIALSLLPPGNESHLPVTVKADGDCMPAAGSVFAYGSDQFSDEIRARIVIEHCLNSEYYLEEGNLLHGADDMNSKRKGLLIKAYAMYSDEYYPGTKLTDRVIKEIYEQEVINITKKKVFMGIWQMHSLSSVLQMPLFSVYPELGNPIVRSHLNRTIEPREKSTEYRGRILWTTTRTDMTKNNWVPNHFVPVLPDNEILETLEEQVDSIPRENTRIKEAYHETVRKRKRETVTEVKGECDSNVLSIENCLNAHVLLQYNTNLYPGYVEDIDIQGGTVFVECMHRVGRKNANCFFWPKKILDRDWYDVDDIIAIIPKPSLIEGTHTHYEVDNERWHEVMDKFQNNAAN